MSAARSLTVRQRQTLDFIRDHQKEHGFAPTLREIGDHMGIRSTNGVTDHLRALERKGFIRKDDMKSRAIVILEPDPDVTPITPICSDECQMFIAAARALAQRQQLSKDEVMACAVVLDSDRCLTFSNSIADLARHYKLSRREIEACCTWVVR